MSAPVPAPAAFSAPADPHAWFSEAKLGLFIHWGLYSIRATGEWAIYRERVPYPVYRNSYLPRFAPDRFDPAAWARAARAAGFRYVVFTAKHHDGFCLWPSATTDFHVGNTPHRRDVVAAVLAACRAEGLRVGLYFSVWDLSQAGLSGGMGSNLDGQGKLLTGLRSDAWTPSAEGVALMKAQITELLTGYGPIDIFWFDVARAPAAAYDGEAVLALCRRLQPAMLVNDRLGLPADLVTPENEIPAAGLRDAAGRPLRWESCLCYNQSWGYTRDDTKFKGPARVIAELAEIVGKGGNCLLNVGPNARGEFPAPEYPELLAALGEWTSRHADALYGAEPWSFDCWTMFDTKVVYTRRPGWLHVFVLECRDDGRVFIPRIPGKRYVAMRMADDWSELRWAEENYLTLEPAQVTLQLPRRRPEHGVSVVSVELAPE